MAVSAVTLDFSLDSSITARLMLFENVRNISVVKDKIMSGKLLASFIRPYLICDKFQVLVAANKAVQRQQNKSMKTKTVYTEIVYCLSPSKNIIEALKTFGTALDDTHLLVVTFDERSVSEVLTEVDGSLCDIEKLREFMDEELIRKVYKIPDLELTSSKLLDSVVTRIATKDLGN